ncbi:N-acetylhexosaminidase, partial [Obba rivulosa]
MVALIPFPLLLGLVLLSHGARALWPIPRSLTTGSSAVKLSKTFAIHVDIAHPPQDLLDAVARSTSRLQTDKFQRLVLGGVSQDITAVHTAHEIKSLILALTASAPVRNLSEEATMAINSRSESYTLSLPTHQAQAILTANSTLGLFRGLATFEQLWYDLDGTKYLLNGPLEIADEPAFPYRGFSFDTSRNFYPVSDILRTIDAMSMVKLSILYWHIIDSQSFPLEVSELPYLSVKGAYSTNEVYSEQDVQQIVAYANARGIDVIMELDSPGHTTAISYGYPQHIACANKSPWATYASEPPAGQLRIASNATIQFAKTLFGSVSSKLHGTMTSSGGDEVNLPCWAEDKETQADLARTNITIEQALDSFIGEVQGVLKKNGKVPFIKSDMVLTHNVTVTNDTVVVVWQKSADAPAVASRNLRLIHQPSDYFYLDCGAGEWLGADILGNSWCDPFKTWQRAYSFDPLANLTEPQQHLVLGGQMPIWSEQTDPENLDPIVWPRLASGAEVFWTGATLPDGSPRLGPNTTSGTQVLARLHELRFRLVDRGVRAIALQPKWCVLRPGDCDL